MRDEFRKQTYNNLNLKETGELVDIWQKNNRTEWTDLAFDVIREILINRLGELPPQSEPNLNYQQGSLPAQKLILNLLMVPAVMLLFGLMPLIQAYFSSSGASWERFPTPAAKPVTILGVSNQSLSFEVFLFVLAEDEQKYWAEASQAEWNLVTNDKPHYTAPVCNKSTNKFSPSKRPFSDFFVCSEAVGVSDMLLPSIGASPFYTFVLDQQDGTIWIWRGKSFSQRNEFMVPCCASIGFLIGLGIFLKLNRKTKQAPSSPALMHSAQQEN